MNWAVIREPTILITAAVYGVLGATAVAAGLFGIWLAVLLVVSSWRYCYQVLRAVAQGRRRIPPPDLDSCNPIGEWGVFWHFVSFPGLILATMPYQPLGLVVAVIVALAFPASAALMVLTSSLSQSFNPAGLIAFARIVGPDYWRLVLACAACLGGAFLLLRYGGLSFGFLSLAAFLALLLWALLAAFALAGAAIRANRKEFEIAGEYVPREEEFLKHRHEDRRKQLDIAYASFRSGLDSSGYRTLRELVTASGDSLEVNHWLVENMLEWREQRYALEVAAKLMPRLLARGDGAAALDLYHRCRRRDPDFSLPPADAGRLAEYAVAFGQTGVATELGYNRESLLKQASQD